MCICGEGNGNPLSPLAWKIPWTEEPGGLQSMDGVAKSRTRLSDQAQHSRRMREARLRPRGVLNQDWLGQGDPGHQAPGTRRRPGVLTAPPPPPGPPPGFLLCPCWEPRSQASSVLQPGCGRVRPPSLTGLLCGCGAVGGCGAAEERRAAGGRRLASPGPGPGRRPRREITVFTPAGAGPLGAGHCGRATVFAGSRADPFREWRASRLNYVFIRGGVVSPPTPGVAGAGWVARIP